MHATKVVFFYVFFCMNEAASSGQYPDLLSLLYGLYSGLHFQLPEDIVDMFFYSGFRYVHLLRNSGIGIPLLNILKDAELCHGQVFSPVCVLILGKGIAGDTVSG